MPRPVCRVCVDDEGGAVAPPMVARIGGGHRRGSGGIIGIASPNNPAEWEAESVCRMRLIEVSFKAGQIFIAESFPKKYSPGANLGTAPAQRGRE